MRPRGVTPTVDLTGYRVLAYWVGENQPIAFHVPEIAEDGGVLESQILWEIGDEIPLELWLPGEVRHRVKARVLGQARGPEVGMRISFTELSPGARAALGRYLARRGARR